MCSGIGSDAVAWHPIGWEAAAFAEIDGHANSVLQHHFPDIPNHGDFTTIKADEHGPVDLLTGGTPCQSFSVAGLRRGLDDDRGNLALEFCRLADRLRPRWIVWENVQESTRQLPTILPIRVSRKVTWELTTDGKTAFKSWSPINTTQTKAMRSPAFWPDFRNSGMGSPTELWTLNTSEWNRTLGPSRSDGGVCSLSDILETGDHLSRFCLSPKACAGILRRAEQRGKRLPEALARALGAVAESQVSLATSP